MIKKQLCIVTGVGPEKGTGAEIAKYFSEKNYIVAMIARNSENLFNLEKNITILMHIHVIYQILKNY